MALSGRFFPSLQFFFCFFDYVHLILFRATIDVHEEALHLGLNAAYNIVFEMQQFVSSLCFNQIRTPKLHWSQNMDRLTIGGETLVISRFRSGIQDLIQDTKAILNELTGDQRFATRIPENIRDDLPSTTRGYSWLDHGPFTEFPHAYLSFLIHRSKWDIAVFDEGGGIVWNVAALHQIMNLCAQLNGNLMVLNFILSDNRGTQLTDQQIRNALQPRNLYHPINEAFWLTRRTKVSNLTGRYSCIPSFIPPVVLDIMEQYLAGGIRDVEEIFAHILYSPEAAELYHT